MSILNKLFHKGSSNNEILPDLWLGPYALTDKDMAVLEAGEEIMIPPYTDKHGKYIQPKYVVMKNDIDGNKNITLIQRKTYYIVLENRIIPDSWLGHIFTEDEKKQLEDGFEIVVSDCCDNETGKPIGKKTAIVMEELDDGNTVLMLDYKVHVLNQLKEENRKQDNKNLKNEVIPDSWLGHVFTEDEKTKLKAGLEVEASDFISKKTGKSFHAIVTFEKDVSGAKRIVPHF